jgi:hypothetical protein
LKTAFKILPTAPATLPQHLLIEIGQEGLSIIYYSIAPFQVEGWMNFHFDKNQPSSQMAAAVDELLEKESLPPLNSCHIFFNFKESTLVPRKFFREEEAAAMLDCLYGSQPTDAVFWEPLNSIDAVNIYRVDDQLYNLLNNKFLSAVFYHSHSILLPYLLRVQEELFCTVYQDSIRVVLSRGDKLQIVQYFEYNTPSDVAYHLLNVCGRHQVSPSEIRLNLTGFIERDSNLYEELYKYFLDIRLAELPDGVLLSGGVSEMPAHFFSHLIALGQCVS